MQSLDTAIIPVLHKVIMDAEKTLLELNGYNVELTMKLKNQEKLTREDATVIILQKLVCETFAASWADIIGKNRQASLVDARYTYIYLMVTVVGYKNFHVSRQLGIDHTTITHAMRRMKNLIECNDPISEKVLLIKEKLLAL